MSKIHQNFQKFDSFYQKCRKYTGIFNRISKIWGKMIKNDYTKIIPKFSTSYQKLSTFGLSLTVKNVPGISDQNFWFRMVIFPKIHRSSKILMERSA